ncbi:hypothetical protein EDB81DRAFT_782439 [Dactylonectria macrodidyma]|uniref:Zn(2)-C6 fungal-type domain-containing protein n=1 Tax=Dactylonectria macrodidyma TaxID=307937 RepID=A0A9P9FNS4_9HYPO|nr:hypothetical protein EDB81DRAFT_782439 [Dactylonectria macrodidyma]
MSSSFSPSGHFPQRRRVIQACVNCRLRKTRCDAAQPKCSLCTIQNVDCVYRDAQQLRIDHNTKVLLDRLEILEERVLSSLPSHKPTESTVDRQDGSGEAASFELQIPLSHTANANHVFSWPMVSELLSESPDWGSGDATDVFFEPSLYDSPISHPPETWRLSQNQQLPLTAAQYHALLHEYFLKVNVFFPLLSMEECAALLDSALSSELNTHEELELSTAQYALVLMILCLASLVADGEIRTIISVDAESRHNEAPTQKDQMHYQLWNKAKLCLGWLSSDISIPAAQCAMLASIYMGATGNVAESFFWAHSTAVKVETIARSIARKNEAAPDSFRRLYWISFIYEGDFVSEISITLPSGIARYEDVIPYPDFNIQHPQMSPDHAATSTPAHRSQEELFGFQISTNAAIRRFLNRVNSVVYDNKEQYRAARANYASWLLRISDDLWSHHEAIYQNLPDILLTSQPQLLHSMNNSFTQIDNGIPSQNKPWNVIRLRGRYYAGQYIIHRPFVEFALLNIANFDSHPCKADVLKKARMCLDGCQGFVELFGNQPANSITSLFATGMAVFTMTLILMVSSICSIFRDILPASLETSIDLGQQILARFSRNIKEFKWHLSILQRVDVVRKSRL